MTCMIKIKVAHLPLLYLQSRLQPHLLVSQRPLWIPSSRPSFQTILLLLLLPLLCLLLFLLLPLNTFVMSFPFTHFLCLRGIIMLSPPTTKSLPLQQLLLLLLLLLLRGLIDYTLNYLQNCNGTHPYCHFVSCKSFSPSLPLSFSNNRSLYLYLV